MINKGKEKENPRPFMSRESRKYSGFCARRKIEDKE